METITSPDTEQFTFEAALLLSLLANFHKSDAAKLNPYLRCIRETKNDELMRKICWASNFAADAVVKYANSGSRFYSFRSNNCAGRIKTYMTILRLH